MHRLKLHKDITPVSEFRANAAELLEQMRKTGRPLVLTQRGYSTAVVLDVAEYESMVEEIELLRDLRTAAEQIAAGKGVTSHEAREEIRRRLKK